MRLSLHFVHHKSNGFYGDFLSLLQVISIHFSLSLSLSRARARAWNQGLVSCGARPSPLRPQCMITKRKEREREKERARV